MAKKTTKAKVVQKKEEKPKIINKIFAKPVVLMRAEDYLLSVGTRPSRIAPRVTWAKGQGFTVLTAAEWENLFLKY
tara:strand:+ start:6528 stop:6755 length:228 start_codon:yes stop_codon:yes gene_type:complete